MKVFWIDEERNISITYEQLLSKINESKTIKRYIFSENPYEVALDLIVSMAIGANVEIIDYDLSEEELLKLGLSKSKVEAERIEIDLAFQDVKQIFDCISDQRDKWKLSLYTSGTTGKPKKITHTYKSMTKKVAFGNKYENSVWALAYNLTHFAGLQVFYQAFLNKNTIVHVFDSKKERLQEIILKYGVTHISATPTYYRSILPYLVASPSSIERISIGGEKFDGKVVDKLKELFPGAKVKNIYASTEAGSLLASEGDVFVIKDSDAKKVKISENNELLVHRDLIGYSESIFFDGDWYPTGDIVSSIDSTRFKIVSRKNEMLNIGGYKVNPLDIENTICELEFVEDVIVFGRENRITGQILATDIKLKDECSINEIEAEIEIRKYLEDKYQAWKIPKLYNFVNTLNKTRSGKKVRR